MTDSQTWYIVKQPDGHCQIVSDEQVNVEPDPEARERWGPFPSQAEAIARRVGLIRAGKCQPV
ncbi:DDE transposase family protein [cyanobacterium TDX16]|nr:DDE transposase family protein [cyanobacterium TDX16]